MSTDAWWYVCRIWSGAFLKRMNAVSKSSGNLDRQNRYSQYASGLLGRWGWGFWKQNWVGAPEYYNVRLNFLAALYPILVLNELISDRRRQKAPLYMLTRPWFLPLLVVVCVTDSSIEPCGSEVVQQWPGHMESTVETKHCQEKIPEGKKYLRIVFSLGWWS